jgi:hypothetical protein
MDTVPKARNHLLQAEALQLLFKGNYGEALALWLNTSRDARARREFSDAIRSMNRSASRVRDAFTQSLDNSKGWRSRTAGKKFMRVLKRESFRSPRILTRARAEFTPARLALSLEECTYSADKRWVLNWYYPDERRRPADAFRKGQALSCFIVLAEYGRLDRMRECLRCGMWLYARFSHQRFCSTKCQQAHYWASPEWKAHRRQWMRNYRSLQESGKVK